MCSFTYNILLKQKELDIQGIEFNSVCIMDNYLCVDFLCFAQTKLHVTSKGQGFENRTYNYVSGMSIPELIINIITCYLFVNDMKSAVILSCHSKVVDYYLQKWFVIHKKIQEIPWPWSHISWGYPPLSGTSGRPT